MKPSLLSKLLISKWIPKRKLNSHKGNYGHVLIIAGSQGMSGAPVLSAYGAMRGGAGLVTVATPLSQQPIVAKHLRPEAMTLPLAETSDGAVSSEAIPTLLNYIQRRRVSCIAIGPGLSRSFGSDLFVRELLTQLPKNHKDLKGVVLDADAFMALTPTENENELKNLYFPIIVTPHVGEMSRFCGVEVKKIEQDRISFSVKFAKLYHVICVLKGAQTVIGNGDKTWLNTTGNPGMATGGSGDVLTGLISAWVGILGKNILNKKSSVDYLLKAAIIGVFIHGLAGDLAKKNKTEISMLAGDIVDQLPNAFKITVK